jgi:hypothetical protein
MKNHGLKAALPLGASMFIVAVLLIVVGCNSNATPPETSAPRVDVTRNTEKGPVRLTTHVDRTSAEIADKITMTVDVRAPRGVAVQFADAPQLLGKFDVTHVNDRFDIPDGDERQWSRTYELESLTSGELEIPALEVQFSDRRSGSTSTDTIQSEPVPVQIVSVLEGQTDPTQFRDIKGVVELPSPTERTNRWIVYALGGGTALALAAASLLMWRRYRGDLSPAQWALAQLDELEDNALPEHGLVDEFYCRLTDIVRRYLERQIAIHAPLLTTDEFLAAMQNEPVLAATHRKSLGELLVAADMVKFARFEPGSTEASETIDVARRFVMETAPHEHKQLNTQQREVDA